MTRSARRGGTVRNGRRHEVRRRGGVGLAVLEAATAPEPPAVVTDPLWARRVRRAARVAAWALPAHALALLWLTLAGGGAVGPAEWAAGHGPAPQVLVVGCWWLALVAFVAVAALLAGLRGRTLAGVGLLVGLAGVVLLRSADGGEALAGAALVSGAWLLLGLAVWRSRPMSRADGVLLMVSAPLVALAGTDLWLLVPLGALLLAAGGIGVAWTGARTVRGEGADMRHGEGADMRHGEGADMRHGEGAAAPRGGSADALPGGRPS